MFEWWKQADKKLKQKLSKVNLFNKYPNYFISKRPFQICFIAILFVILMGWAAIGFNLAYISISCPASSPLPCHNPVYVCSGMAMLNSTYHDGHFWNDGLRCNVIPDWICERVPCDKRYLQPGEKYGDDARIFTNTLYMIFILIILAFVINHYLCLIKKR